MTTKDLEDIWQTHSKIHDKYDKKGECYSTRTHAMKEVWNTAITKAAFEMFNSQMKIVEKSIKQEILKLKIE